MSGAKLVTLYGDELTEYEKNRRAIWLARQVNRCELMGADPSPYMDAAELLGIWGLVARVAKGLGKRALGEVKYRVNKARGNKAAEKEALAQQAKTAAVQSAPAAPVKDNKNILMVALPVAAIAAILLIKK